MDAIKSIVIGKELSLLEPETRSSVESLSSLISDDFIEFGSSGLIYDKENVLEGLPQERGVSFKANDFKVRELSESVVLNTFTLEKTLDSGEILMSLRSSIWKNIDGSWQIVFHQGTRIDNKSLE